MGNGASSAIGPSRYSLDELLVHWSDAGELTAGKLQDIGVEHFDVTLPIEALWKKGVCRRVGAGEGDAERCPERGDAVSVDMEAFRATVSRVLTKKGNELALAEKPTDIYALITPLEARRGFPRALAALKANSKLAQQPMRGVGAGSPWLPLHCVLLLGPKFQGWWWPLGEPLVAALIAAHPRAAQHRVLEGAPHPFGLLPLELAATRGWDARVVTRVHAAYRAAASMLDPIRIPKAALAKSKADAKKKAKGAGASDKKAPPQAAPEIALHEIKGGGTVATLAAAGWKKEDAPESVRGLRWVRKAAEACKPKCKLDVLLLLPKPDKDLNAWTDGREMRRLFEDKCSARAVKAAKHSAKRAKRAESLAKKAMGKAKKIADDPAKARAAVAELLEASKIYRTVAQTLVEAHRGFVVFDFSKLDAVRATYEAAANAALERADGIVSSQTAPLRIRARLPLNPTEPGQLARAWFDAQSALGPARVSEIPSPAAAAAPAGSAPKPSWHAPSAPPAKGVI